MTLAERLKRAAEKEGGVPKLAQRIGCGRQTIYDVIQKGRIPSGRTLLKMQAAGFPVQLKGLGQPAA